MSEGAPASRLAVLLFTDVVGSTELKSRRGTATYAKLLARHNELFETLCARLRGAEILKHTGDGYFAAFATPSDAVRFALAFQSAMRNEPWVDAPLSARVGIHFGEVAVVQMAGKSDVIGLAADFAARVMSLAVGGQILCTREAFNAARQFISVHPTAPRVDAPAAALKWLAHGPYLFKGFDEPVDIFEVGAEGFAPLSAPGSVEKATRVVPHDQEQTLGWRPAIGLQVPGRNSWKLERKLGEGGFGEVWLGRHDRTKDQRVFKFCFDAQRLRSFKRELTLFRLLKGALGDRQDIARLYEVQLHEPPYFLESEYTEGGNLAEWAERLGGVEKVSLDARLEIVAQVADAVAAAHSVGVLHKDIKPSNILIAPCADGRVQPRLSDFGIGLLYTTAELSKQGITQAGFTQATLMNDSSRTGTRMYAPPECLADQPFTVRGDVYGCGVLLYQMSVGDLKRPVPAGWERDVEDDVLRGLIGDCVDGDVDRRLGDAKEISRRLRHLPAEREERRRAQQAALRAVRRRTRLRLATVGAVVIVLATAGVLRELTIARQTDERDQARARQLQEREQENLRQRTEIARLNQRAQQLEAQLRHAMGP